MTELTLDRVRSVLNTKASAYAVADYIRLLDTGHSNGSAGIGGFGTIQ